MLLEPDSNLQPGELVLSDRIFDSSLSFAAGLSSPSLAIEDVRAGRWNGASVRLLAGDWAEEGEPSLLCKGVLGTFLVENHILATTVDLLPPAARMTACVQTSRASLGDAKCRVDMRSRRVRVQVTGRQGAMLNVDRADTEAFRMGRLRWITGKNSGHDQTIMTTDDGAIGLDGEPPSPVSIGDRALISEGCDGRRSTCSVRFSNILNFRGEPDLPGSNILLRFPGA
jgi:uncharacterized phage protein (TIGR02218 family)